MEQGSREGVPLTFTGHPQIKFDIPSLGNHNIALLTGFCDQIESTAGFEPVKLSFVESVVQFTFFR